VCVFVICRTCGFSIDALWLFKQISVTWQRSVASCGITVHQPDMPAMELRCQWVWIPPRVNKRFDVGPPKTMPYRTAQMLSLRARLFALRTFSRGNECYRIHSAAKLDRTSFSLVYHNRHLRRSVIVRRISAQAAYGSKTRSSPQRVPMGGEIALSTFQRTLFPQVLISSTSSF
jgi:hypothetical protein